jgi:hypothetical protein
MDPSLRWDDGGLRGELFTQFSRKARANWSASGFKR